MTGTYDDADSDEMVKVGSHHMTLRAAVRMYIRVSETAGVWAPIVFRDDDKTPSSLDAADLGRLAELERFK